MVRFQRAVADVRDRLLSHGAHSSDQLAACLVTECAQETNSAGAGLSLMTAGGAAAILAATDQVAITLEELQFDYGEGPCTTTIETRAPVLQADLAQTGYLEWPMFTGDALAAGARAVFAFPLRFADVHLGTLELYRSTPGALTWPEYYQAQVYTEAALTLLIQTQAGEQCGTLYPHLTKILDDRIEVHHASGMVAVQAGVSVDDAASLLRARAFAEGRSVLELAIDVVEGEATLKSS